MYKMVIFDLDGTLLNTLDDLADAGNYALFQLGLPVHEIEEYKYFIGNGIPKLIERMLPKESDETLRTKAFEIFCSYYNIHMNDKTKPYDGILEMLETLKNNNIVSVVVTNKSAEFADSIIRKYFDNLVDKVYGSVEGLPRKPDPYWVNKALSDFGADNDEVLYVGDSGVDMETAKNASLTACGVTWGFRDEKELVASGADFICGSCEDILDIIRKCN